MLDCVCMGTLIQIRDVPDEVHRKIKARAAAGGVSMTEYVRSILGQAVARPTPEELAARVRARGIAPRDEPSERSIRALREHGE